ncbi:triglyceride lipase [Saccharomycopsis crataegensis]|uniref:Triglyceride lipase n=1 Tax=Saccharomycopsis crataegensis TaxID=43959 RepID=A0AAV5QLP0_9ASCO|nr:triglyceride lipase [Saccharomycopsis crataegensis]
MSNLYNKSQHSTTAAYPRYNPASTISPYDVLEVVYNKYVSTATGVASKPTVNLIFVHGNGMNKSIWNYHANYLFNYQKDHESPFHISTIVTFDSVNHGDSAVINKGKLGITFDWKDNGKDILEIIRAERLHLNNDKLILVGHSFGAFSALYANLLNPGIFDSVVVIDPIVYPITTKNNNRSNSNPGKKEISILGYNLFSRKLKSEFDSAEEMKKYFFKDSSWKSMKQEIVQDMYADEYLETYDVATDTIKYKLKTSLEQQMITYSNYYSSIETFGSNYHIFRNPIHFILGGRSNSFNRSRFLQEIIPKYPVPEITWSEIYNGSHLLHAEYPKEFLELILNFIVDRVDKSGKKEDEEGKKYRKSKEELKNNYIKMLDGRTLTENQRDEIFKDWYKQLKNGGFWDCDFIPSTIEASKLKWKL